jgi:catechol 2,3-dioxygenase-like lactoylglutathione lyase family enzyme
MNDAPVDDRLLDEDEVMQICFVTDDLERSLQWFSELTGKRPSHIGKAADPDEAQAVYHGAPATVSARLAIFKFRNIDVEFLEPGPEPSAWRDVLEAKGPGCHHIAFKTRNLTRRTAFIAGLGHASLQQAEFDGGHGRYAYFDTEPSLGVQVELLEWNDDMQPQGK